MAILAGNRMTTNKIKTIKIGNSAKKISIYTPLSNIKTVRPSVL
ncbi:hypothetical protein [Moraxella lacunata]